MKYLIGIQPTSPDLHIGNYLSCIKPGLDKQNEGHEVVFLIADLHAQTTMAQEVIDKNTMLMRRQLIELGIKAANIQIQSDHPIIPSIFVSLFSKVSYGTLARMPQYKDKKDSVEHDFGLLTYPLLMAADIFHFDPDIILVGEDQVAHIELTNDLGPRANFPSTYKYELSPYSKIMSLVDPTKKMSKSLGDKHVLYLKDDWHKKLRAANTNEPGIKNLKLIATGLGIPDAEEYTQYGILKLLMSDYMEKLFGGL